ncbi:MAG: winged helix-turn-helix domain-containing protein, partial [bacterium]
MAVPDFQSLMLPLLKLVGDGQQHTIAEAVERLAQECQLSDDDRTQLLRSGQTRLYNRVGWTTTYLKKAGLLRAVGPGRFQLTERGHDVLASRPAAIDVAFLESRFPEMSEFRKAGSRDEVVGEEPPATFNAADGTWSHRAGVEERVRDTLEQSIPNEAIRRAALNFLALAIENADEERGSGWYVRETEHGLRLMTGRLLACEVTRSKLRVSVIGPIGDDIRGSLGAESDKDEEFKKVPGRLLSFPVEHAAEALDLLRDGLNSFVDVAMARVRRPVSLEDHNPEAVAYIARVVGRELPQPVVETQDSEQLEDASDEDEVGASREPRVRGRPPIFEHGQRSIASLMSDIEREEIALPDLQRPFVWEDTKVRDLLDSLFLGFPVGTLVLWHTSNVRDARVLGAERPGLRATTLVIDGQQRLTSLYAVLRGVDVV